ncbi:unnamed protein product [Pseudo-nitzschia multistriata]|uniref:Uncharacterized protein n=1 Tax=Pseudo-nitzschia multistriata TaxID=183589 RepID=A0A448ZFG7_9STRA|nr:unnamed protein product [Pseudo-nitzschia multistriata]
MNVPTNTHQLETGSLAPATSTPNPVQITENPLGDIAMDVETANEDSSVGVKPPMTPSESFPEDIDVAASMSMSMSMSMNRFLEDSTNREVSVWTPLSDKRGDTF